jgi:hypothetical protein
VLGLLSFPFLHRRSSFVAVRLGIRAVVFLASVRFTRYIPESEGGLRYGIFSTEGFSPSVFSTVHGTV